MKIRVEVTVEIDAETWAEEYGIEPSEVRDDFRACAESAVREIAGRAPLVDADYLAERIRAGLFD